MLQIENLKQFAEKNEIYQYQSGDALGVFYKKILELTTEWERQVKKGFTTSLPPAVVEEELNLALDFIKLCGYKEDKEQKFEWDKQLQIWAIAKAKAYFNKRMEELECEKEEILTTVLDGGEPIQVPVFSCDISTGNIDILITRLDGEYITYQEKQEDNTPEEYVKTAIYKMSRLAQPKAGGAKYLMPSGQGTYPFFPEILKQAYAKGEKIETIFITEGAFKAFKATKEGIPTIAFSSITHYKCADSTKQKPALHRDIVAFIKKCECKNVVILWDGDCKNINLKDLELEQELSDRPNGFFQAAKKTRDLIVAKFKAKEKDKEDECIVKVWFSTIRTSHIPNHPKGIDDLLILNKGIKKEISKNALRLDGKGNPFFFFANITSHTDLINEFFGFASAKQFHTKHIDLIGSKEFLFKGDRYKYSEIKNDLVLLQPKFLQHLRWIGDDFYQNIDVPVPNKDGHLTQKELRAVRKGTLQDLYGRDFVRFLVDKHYMGFCNIPNHFDYSFEIETVSGKFYNKYFPFEHTPMAGKCDVIIDFVKHIFGDQWEMGLDYMQLLLLKPMQKLPVIILYSPENNTGKSKFGELLAQIFKNNTVFINNDDLKSEFGLERFVDKLVAVCEETLLQRKADSERVKFITTAEEAVGINPKGMSFYTLHTYVKMIFTSNNLRMIYASEHDERFWIIRVPPPQKIDPDLMEKMKVEIPAFVHFLQNRKLSTERKSRMWFDKDLIKTDILEEVVKVNEHTDLQEIRSKLEDYFIDFQNENDLILSTKDIIEELMPGKSRAWMEEVLGRMGVERYQVNEMSVVKRSYFMKKEVYFEDGHAQYKDVKIQKPPQRVWVMPREKFINKNIAYEVSDLDAKVIEEINSAVPF